MTNPWKISTRTAGKNKDSKGCEEGYLSYIMPKSSPQLVEPTLEFLFRETRQCTRLAM